MDVVSHYQPTTLRGSNNARLNKRESQRRKSMPDIAASVPERNSKPLEDARKANEEQHGNFTTFNRSVQISLMEPVGSMSLSPANRDVVLASRKGLFIIDLENPYDQPRFLPHLTTWVPADVQWNPHPARANWVASTSNNKLLVWNLDRPAAMRNDPVLSMASVISVAGSSPSMRSAGYSGNPALSPSTFSATVPYPHHHHHADILGSTSRLSSISHVLHAHTRAITDINWSPFHPDVLASCGIDTWTWAWDLRDPSKPKQGYSAWNAAMTQVKWNRATQHRLATSCDNKVLIWDDRKGTLPLATIEAHENKIYGVDWSRDKSVGMSKLVTCSLDGSVKWWDLDSPAAQHAIANRQLVTEAETTILTDTPVWRARHLPFGQGVMTLPQRGDTSLSMWSKSQVDEPVHRFNGHRDLVKEYLFRTRGGEDPSSDQRKFQLITWSKDQTLRLWPITEDMLSSVGHKRGAPINLRQTRLNAPNISYRNPPVAAEDDTIVNHFHAMQSAPTKEQNTMLSVSLGNPSGVMQASPLSQGSVSHLSQDSASTSMVPPSGATRSLLSGSAKGSTSVHSNGSGSLRVASPQNTFGLLDKSTFLGNTNSQSKTEMLKNDHTPIRRKMSMTQMAVRDSHRRKVGSTNVDASMQPRLRDVDINPANKFGSAGRQSIKTIDTNTSAGKGVRTVSWTGSNDTLNRKGRGHNSSLGGHSRKKRDINLPKSSKVNPARVMSKQAASHNFMTRGSTARSGQLNMTGAAQKGNASHVDAVGWIAGVRMGKEARSPSVNALDRKAKRSMPDSKRGMIDNENERTEKSSLTTGEEDIVQRDEEDEEDTRDAAQVISEEIMTISKSLSNVTFEKIDVSTRQCTANCYGPWSANKSVPCFIRVSFFFPSRYPEQSPRFELEHNASVPLKTRAFLLRNITNILEMCAEQRKASMEPCLLFLSGVDQEDPSPKVAPSALGEGPEPFWLPGEEEQELEEEEDVMSTLKMPPRLCGASFSANGFLVTFSPCSSPQARIPGSVDMAGGPISDSHHTGVAPSSVRGRSRFLQSYSALSGAMSSLARLAKEGMSVQDLDVVQLMGDQAFFNKRLQQPLRKDNNARHRRTSSSNMQPIGMSLRSTSKSGLTQHVGPEAASNHDVESAPSHTPIPNDNSDSDLRRSRTRSRPGRARSASPAPTRSRKHLLAGAAVTESGSASPLLRTAILSGASGAPSPIPNHPTSVHVGTTSKVKVWNLKELLEDSRPASKPSTPSMKPLPPPLIRRRSASTPSSPSPMTPRSEANFSLLPLAVPSSLNDGAEELSDLPQSIAASRNAAVQDDEDDEDGAYEEEFIIDEDGSVHAYRLQDSESDEDDSDEEDGNGDGNAIPPTGMSTTAERVLDTLIWTIPFAFLYLMLDILIQQQYAIQPNLWEQFLRLINTLPILTIFIYATAVRGNSIMPRFALQLLFLTLGTATGCGFLYIYMRSAQGVVVRRTAPLGTLWIYCTTKMDLSLTVVSLAVIYGFVTHHNLDLFN
ncbi:uncharacterized protein FA14DRAFT_160800 [Meira miltonrushii]|uniref:DUF7719 domain-containing protein n=1 Tax=Meira miltonrushii TaxID=1280837 RepID=A0A316VDP6_9BASI|nr:uncharacterized protein FA14DRAFT_160800 [Meira miltonrushii]PWN35797.1 hypothetical protein FA14DRAFT_160800 [Meira miltonrushii]